MKAKVIAIDGPSGSGKSTIAKIVSAKLNLVYLDTGAMFRAIGLFLSNKGLEVSDSEKINFELANMNFNYASSDQKLVEINGEDLTEKIREHHVSKIASQYSQIPAVREFLKNLQREIASKRPSVLEGRDIGTVIFPDAAIKFYLTADSKIRAERRLAQLKEKDPNLSMTVDSILEDIEKRDETDKKREIAPLVKAEDALELDTTSLSINEVCQNICDVYQKNKSLF